MPTTEEGDDFADDGRTRYFELSDYTIRRFLVGIFNKEIQTRWQITEMVKNGDNWILKFGRKP